MRTAAPPQPAQIADRIKRLRAEKGWSQRQLADRMDGVSLRTLESIEAGTHRARDTTYGRVALACGVSLDYLLRGEAS